MTAVRWVAIAVRAVLVVLTIVAGAGSRTEPLRRLVIETLADRLDSEIALESCSVGTFPTVDVRGEGLVVRDVPPLIRIRSFVIHGGMFRASRRLEATKTTTAIDTILT